MINYSVRILLLICLFTLTIKIGAQETQCLDFDGIDDYVEINAKNFNLKNGDDFSFEVWFKTNEVLAEDNEDFVKGNVIFAIQDSLAKVAEEHMLRVGIGGDGGVYLELGFSGSEDTYSAGFNDGEWHHLAISIPANGNQTQIYVDGDKIATDNFDPINWVDADLAYFGQELDNNFSLLDSTHLVFKYTDFFKGRLVGAKLWKSIRSEYDFRQSMQTDGLCGEESDMLACYSFRQAIFENYEDVLLDEVNGNNGKLINFALDGLKSNWIVEDINLDIGDLNISTKIAIGPNPTSDFLNIKWSNVGDINAINIYSIEGRKLADYNNLIFSSELAIDTHNWNAGIYIVELSNSSGDYFSRKILKK